MLRPSPHDIVSLSVLVMFLQPLLPLAYHSHIQPLVLPEAAAQHWLSLCLPGPGMLGPGAQRCWSGPTDVRPHTQHILIS